MMKYLKRVIYAILIIYVGIIVFLMMTFRNFGSHETCPLETITLRDYVFKFEVACSGELSWAVYCKVVKGEEIMFPLTHLGRATGEVEFKLVLSGEQYELIAIIEKSTPHIVYAIYDLKNHQATIFNLADEKENMEVLLQRFNTHQKTPLIWPSSTDDEVFSKLKLH